MNIEYQLKIKIGKIGLGQSPDPSSSKFCLTKISGLKGSRISTAFQVFEQSGSIAHVQWQCQRGGQGGIGYP